LVTVGHFAIDLIASPKIAHSEDTLGGPPTFSSLAARKMGANVSVISKVGSDFPPKYINWLAANKIDLSGLKKVEGTSTTRFILRYEKSTGKRRLLLKSRAPPIGPSDIPESSESKVIHVAPIANELSSETISRLRGLTSLLAFDPQGLVRKFDGQGNVSLKRMEDHRILKNIDIFKSSVDELNCFVNTDDLHEAFKRIHEYGVETVIVTRGTRGSMLSHRGKIWVIPACKPKVFVDATGAGDAFIGAFLVEYVQGKDASWCACVGSASASFVVEGVGPSRFGEKREVYERASEAFERLKTSKL